MLSIAGCRSYSDTSLYEVLVRPINTKLPHYIQIIKKHSFCPRLDFRVSELDFLPNWENQFVYLIWHLQLARICKALTKIIGPKINFRPFSNCSILLIYFFKKWAIPGLFFFIFVCSIQLTVNVRHKFLPMTGFEPRTSGFGSDRSTNWATTTALSFDLFLPLQQFKVNSVLLKNCRGLVSNLCALISHPSLTYLVI